MLPNSRFNQPEREKSIKVTDYNVCRNNTRIWKQKSNHFPHPLETVFFFSPSNRNSAPHICMNCFIWSPWACFIHYKMRRLNMRKPKNFPVMAGDGWVSSAQTPVSSYAEHSKFSKHCSTWNSAIFTLLWMRISMNKFEKAPCFFRISTIKHMSPIGKIITFFLPKNDRTHWKYTTLSCSSNQRVSQ